MVESVIPTTWYNITKDYWFVIYRLDGTANRYKHYRGALQTGLYVDPNEIVTALNSIVDDITTSNNSDDTVDRAVTFRYDKNSMSVHNKLNEGI